MLTCLIYSIAPVTMDEMDEMSHDLLHWHSTMEKTPHHLIHDGRGYPSRPIGTLRSSIRPLLAKMAKALGGETYKQQKGVAQPAYRADPLRSLAD